MSKSKGVVSEKKSKGKNKTKTSTDRSDSDIVDAIRVILDSKGELFPSDPKKFRTKHLNLLKNELLAQNSIRISTRRLKKLRPLFKGSNSKEIPIEESSKTSDTLEEKEDVTESAEFKKGDRVEALWQQGSV